MNIWEEVLSGGGQEKYFHDSLEISICSNRTRKTFENWSTDKVFIVNRNFTLAREIIHDHKFSFDTIFFY